MSLEVGFTSEFPACCGELYRFANRKWHFFQGSNCVVWRGKLVFHPNLQAGSGEHQRRFGGANPAVETAETGGK